MTVSEVMASVHSQDTKPELLVRRWLWAHGYRFRKNDASLPGKPDVVVMASRTAIFINGCFWHQHEGCHYYSTPRTNPEFWQRKFARNKERDSRVRDELRAMGWRTMVIWECQLKPANSERTLETVARLLDEARAEWEALTPRQRKLTSVPRPQTSPTTYEQLEESGTYMAAEDEMDYGNDTPPDE